MSYSDRKERSTDRTSERVREGATFDIVIVAGPRSGFDPWPSVGARTLGTLAAEWGLRCGIFGGSDIRVRGLLPLPETGAVLLAQDIQGRLHRHQARSVVRFSSPEELPDPFPGWHSPGLVPLSTARRLLVEAQLVWAPTVAILGTGSRALRFACEMLEAGVPEVYCIESAADWGGKRFAGWEVERRRFEILGGRLLEAKPVGLKALSPMLWELRVEDSRGVRILEVTRVISAGPFRASHPFREYPRGSLLFEIPRSSLPKREWDLEGWLAEEDGARFVAARIIRALGVISPERREDFERFYKRAKARLKRAEQHRIEPFLPEWNAKWLERRTLEKLRSFAGVPTERHAEKLVASIECIEAMGCNLCERACPESAIQFSRDRAQVLFEDRCTGCGLCIDVCPSATPVLIHEKNDAPLSQLVLSERGNRLRPALKVGEFVQAVNRRGESMGNVRVAGLTEVENHRKRVELALPSHLLWEVRGFRRPRASSTSRDDWNPQILAQAPEFTENRVPILLDGDRRLVRERIPMNIALFETGRAREGDLLDCRDGSCGRCSIVVDGQKVQSCRTQVRAGMSAITKTAVSASMVRGDGRESSLCPCLNLSSDSLRTILREAKITTPDAAVSATDLGSGRCHGQLCCGAFRRLMIDEGIPAETWIDWRFPWTDWSVGGDPLAST